MKRKKINQYRLQLTRVAPILFRILFAAIFIIALTSLIAYARGYRLDMQQRKLTSTGIVAITSSPTAASIYINGELRGVTDLNLTLSPGTYKVEVKKDGFTNWVKEIHLKGEIVMSLDALLFPKNSSLTPATNLGIVKAIPIDQSDKILLFSQSDNTEKDGIYIFDSKSNPVSFFPPLKLIILKQNFPTAVDFSTASVYYSPDYSQAIIEFTTDDQPISYLLSLNGENASPLEITASKDVILAAWDTEVNKELVKVLETFPKPIRNIATDSFKIISFSPDNTKILYQAKKTKTLPFVIKPSLIGADQEEEERTLKPNTMYLYDRKEDKNFRIDIDTEKFVTTENHLYPQISESPIPIQTQSNSATTTGSVTLPIIDHFRLKEILPISWYGDSKHLGILQGNVINIIDYDGSNKRTIYSGPFEKNFFTINSQGKLFILANLNPQLNAFADVYEVGIR